ncbi:MAG TPA: hypothetical protein PK802_02140 [Candidatus Cloacimonadota bacterium]|nr:hypothetical protein [Candidatus Cloacimonadota bacterium]
MKAASDRLKQVIIEKQPWEKTVSRFDQPHTFFYLDSPLYQGTYLRK